MTALYSRKPLTKAQIEDLEYAVILDRYNFPRNWSFANYSYLRLIKFISRP
jgi:hypothetical protein